MVHKSGHPSVEYSNNSTHLRHVDAPNSSTPIETASSYAQLSERQKFEKLILPQLRDQVSFRSPELGVEDEFRSLTSSLLKRSKEILTANGELQSAREDNVDKLSRARKIATTYHNLKNDIEKTKYMPQGKLTKKDNAHSHVEWAKTIVESKYLKSITEEVTRLERTVFKEKSQELFELSESIKVGRSQLRDSTISDSEKIGICREIIDNHNKVQTRLRDIDAIFPRQKLPEDTEARTRYQEAKTASETIPIGRIKNQASRLEANTSRVDAKETFNEQVSEVLTLSARIEEEREQIRTSIASNSEKLQKNKEIIHHYDELEAGLIKIDATKFPLDNETNQRVEAAKSTLQFSKRIKNEVRRLEGEVFKEKSQDLSALNTRIIDQIGKLDIPTTSDFEELSNRSKGIDEQLNKLEVGLNEITRMPQGKLLATDEVHVRLEQLRNTCQDNLNYMKKYKLDLGRNNFNKEAEEIATAFDQVKTREEALENSNVIGLEKIYTSKSIVEDYDELYKKQLDNIYFFQTNGALAGETLQDNHLDTLNDIDQRKKHISAQFEKDVDNVKNTLIHAHDTKRKYEDGMRNSRPRRREHIAGAEDEEVRISSYDLAREKREINEKFADIRNELDKGGNDRDIHKIREAFERLPLGELMAKVDRDFPAHSDIDEEFSALVFARERSLGPEIDSIRNNIDKIVREAVPELMLDLSDKLSVLEQRMKDPQQRLDQFQRNTIDNDWYNKQSPFKNVLKQYESMKEEAAFLTSERWSKNSEYEQLFLARKKYIDESITKISQGMDKFISDTGKVADFLSAKLHGLLTDNTLNERLYNIEIRLASANRKENPIDRLNDFHELYRESDPMLKRYNGYITSVERLNEQFIHTSNYSTDLKKLNYLLSDYQQGYGDVSLLKGMKTSLEEKIISDFENVQMRLENQERTLNFSQGKNSLQQMPTSIDDLKLGKQIVDDYKQLNTILNESGEEISSQLSHNFTISTRIQTERVTSALSGPIDYNFASSHIPGANDISSSLQGSKDEYSAFLQRKLQENQEKLVEALKSSLPSQDSNELRAEVRRFKEWIKTRKGPFNRALTDGERQLVTTQKAIFDREYQRHDQASELIAHFDNGEYDAELKGYFDAGTARINRFKEDYQAKISADMSDIKSYIS